MGERKRLENTRCLWEEGGCTNTTSNFLEVPLVKMGLSSLT